MLQEVLSMTDEQLISLLWERNEEAIPALEASYKGLCMSIAMRILGDAEDAEECVNDTWLKTWYAIPPARPERLPAWLSRVTRSLALDTLDARRAGKRGGGEPALCLEELEECVGDGDVAGEITDRMTLSGIMDRFLGELNQETRTLFLRRYYYCCSIEELSRLSGLSLSAVKVRLHRARRQLKQLLDREGVSL